MMKDLRYKLKTNFHHEFFISFDVKLIFFMKMVLPYNQDTRLLLPPSKVQCEIGSHEKNKINASKSSFFFIHQNILCSSYQCNFLSS